MAGLYPLSRMQQLDANGQLLVGARLFLFDGGTTTPRVGYRDSSLTSPHPNPIIADARGALPLIYIDDGFYRQRLTDASGVLIFDDDGIPVISTTTAGTGTSVDPNSTMKTRDIKIRFDDQPIDGYVRLNGKTIGSVASGGSERANADTQSLYEELWPYPNIALAAGYTKGSSGPADFIANKPLVLPDCAGRGIFGMDDMIGGTPRGVLTSATITNPTWVGSIGGSQQVTISQANLPVYNLINGSSGNFTISGTTSWENTSHTHTFTASNVGDMDRANPHNHGASLQGGGGAMAGNATVGVQGGGTYNGIVSGFAGANNNLIIGNANLTHFHGVSGTTDGISVNHTHTFSGSSSASGITIGSGGSGTATTNLPPVMLFMIYVRL